jgi:hypothetical protein
MVSATRNQLLEALRLAVRPCQPDPKNWYACRGDDDPTVGTSCYDAQCENPDHVSRRPCPNVWHRLDVEVRDDYLDL